MIKTILFVVMIFIGLNYLLMAGTVLLGKWSGYETTCNPIYCTFKSTTGEMSCQKNGVPIPCEEIEKYYKNYEEEGVTGVVTDAIINKILEDN